MKQQDQITKLLSILKRLHKQQTNKRQEKLIKSSHKNNLILTHLKTNSNIITIKTNLQKQYLTQNIKQTSRIKIKMNQNNQQINQLSNSNLMMEQVERKYLMFSSRNDDQNQGILRWKEGNRKRELTETQFGNKNNQQKYLYNYKDRGQLTQISKQRMLNIRKIKSQIMQDLSKSSNQPIKTQLFSLKHYKPSKKVPLLSIKTKNNQITKTLNIFNPFGLQNNTNLNQSKLRIQKNSKLTANSNSPTNLHGNLSVQCPRKNKYEKYCEQIKQKYKKQPKISNRIKTSNIYGDQINSSKQREINKYHKQSKNKYKNQQLNKIRTVDLGAQIKDEQKVKLNKYSQYIKEIQGDSCNDEDKLSSNFSQDDKYFGEKLKYLQEDTNTNTKQIQIQSPLMNVPYMSTTSPHGNIPTSPKNSQNQQTSYKKSPKIRFIAKKNMNRNNQKQIQLPIREFQDKQIKIQGWQMGTNNKIHGYGQVRNYGNSASRSTSIQGIDNIL